ncbi:hypothetical protein D3C75_986020 [compost metagenome]
MASEALATPNRSIRAVAPAVPAEVVNAKPRISVTEDAGRWVAVARLNGVEIARADGDSKAGAYDALLALAAKGTTRN